MKNGGGRMSVYVDVLFALNFSMNYVSLYLGGRLVHRRTHLWRIVIAAAIGAILGILAVLYDISGLILLAVEIAAAVGMVLITFGRGSVWETAKSAASVFAIASLIGGVMTVGDGIIYPDGGESRTLSGNFLLAMAGVFAVYGIIRFVGKRASARSVDVTAVILGRAVSFTALVDSGNLVRDPISARSVILVSGRSLASAVSRTDIDKLMSGDVLTLTDAALSAKIRAVPVRNSSASAVRYGVIPDKIEINVNGRTKEIDAVIVPEDRGITDYGGFSATCPAAVL